MMEKELNRTTLELEKVDDHNNRHIQELKTELNNTKKECQRKNEKIKLLENECEEKTKLYDNTAERAELERTTKQLENILIENDKMKNTINNLIKNTQKQQKVIDEKSEEILEMTQLLQNTVHDKTTTCTTTQKRGLFIADSNRKYIQLPQHINWKPPKISTQ